jgi:hypothetical protein
MLAAPLLSGLLTSAAQDNLTKTITLDFSGISSVIVDARVAKVRLVTGTGAVLQAKGGARFA